MASGKVFDAAKALNSIADKVGYTVGTTVPPRLEALLQRLAKAGHLGESGEELVPMAHEAIKKGLEFLGNTLEVPRDRIPLPGFLGDLVYEVLNEGIDSAARGAGDHPKAGEKPADKSKGGADDGTRMGYVDSDTNTWFPSDCTHRKAPFTPKGGAPAPRISLKQALERGHEIHQRGCVSDAEIAAAKEKSMTTAPASDPSKTSGASASGAAPSAPKAAPSADSIGGYLRLFREEDPTASEGLINAYLAATATNAELKKKFDTVFPKNAYADFRFILKQPPDRWNALLDTFIGVKKDGQDEKAQTARAVDELNTHLAKVPAFAVQEVERSKARIEARKRAWAEEDRTKSFSPTTLLVTVIALVLLLGSAAAIYIYHFR